MYLMSAPATNAFSPAPVRTTTRADSSSASSRSRSRSSVSVSTSSAFSASWRSIVTTATAPSRATSTLTPGPRPCRKSTISVVGAPGPKTPATPCLLQLVRVVRRDRAADDDEHVLGAVLAQQLEDARHERHVRAGEDRDADGVGVLLDRGLDDLLRRLVEAGVDDLHAGVAERAGDDLRAAVVPVEAGLRDDDADLPAMARSLAGLAAAGRIRPSARHPARDEPVAAVLRWSVIRKSPPGVADAGGGRKLTRIAASSAVDDCTVNCAAALPTGYGVHRDRARLPLRRASAPASSRARRAPTRARAASARRRWRRTPSRSRAPSGRAARVGDDGERGRRGSPPPEPIRVAAYAPTPATSTATAIHGAHLSRNARTSEDRRLAPDAPDLAERVAHLAHRHVGARGVDDRRASGCGRRARRPPSGARARPRPRRCRAARAAPARARSASCSSAGSMRRISIGCSSSSS